MENNPAASNPAPDASYYKNVRAEMLPFLPAQIRRGLDVGCAEGFYGAMLREKFGAEIWGIEYDAAVAERARARLNEVRAGDAIEQIGRMPDGHFDFMSCNDVLEHLADPWAFLRAARPKLAPGAVVVSSIPNVRYFHALETILRDKDFPAVEEGIFDRTHLRFFTRKSIERLFAESGYTIERIAGINPTRKNRFKIWNTLTFGWLSDCRWMQYACVARSNA